MKITRKPKRKGGGRAQWGKTKEWKQIAEQVAAQTKQDAEAVAAAVEAQFLWVRQEIASGSLTPVQLNCLGTFRPIASRITKARREQVRDASAARAQRALELSLGVLAPLEVPAASPEAQQLLGELQQSGGLEDLSSAERELMKGLTF